MPSKEETKASFLYDIRKVKQLPVPVVFVQYKNAPKASYLEFPQISSDFLQICYTDA